MKEEEAVRRYFSKPGFERFLRLLKRQYTASQEGVRGYVTLTNLSEVERETLDGFYRTYSPHLPGETKRYSVKKFEKLLLESRYEMRIVQLLEMLEGESVLTRQEQETRLSAEWRSLIEEVIADVEERSNSGAWSEPESEEDLGEKSGSGSHAIPDSVMNWIRGLVEEFSPGTRILRSVFAGSRDEAFRCLRDCVRALIRLQDGKSTSTKLLRLPILAAEITGDAHALDWKYPLGRLFWWGLTACYGYGQQTSENPQETVVEQAEATSISSSQAMVIREGYRQGGVADDDLSSQVMLYAPAIFGVREERVLTLRQVERLSVELSMRVKDQRIYMVENPSVFAELIDTLASTYERTDNTGTGTVTNTGTTGTGKDTMLICGNGQPTTAVLKLLDALLRNGTERTLYYAGDLDPAGLSIAAGLQSRYPTAFRVWRMDQKLYKRYVDRGVALTADERSRLQRGIPYTWNPELAKMMATKGVKLYQELWIYELLQDMQDLHSD